MSDATGKREVVQRHQIADYLNIGTSASAKWVLLGYGVYTLNENVGAESESVKYINESSESSSVTSYKTTFPLEAYLVTGEEGINALYTVGRNHLTGAAAEFELCRVELFNSKASADSSFAARKFLVSAEITEIGGDKKQSVKGNLNAVGDPVDGYFNTKTPAFTAA